MAESTISSKNFIIQELLWQLSFSMEYSFIIFLQWIKFPGEVKMDWLWYT